MPVATLQCCFLVRFPEAEPCNCNGKLLDYTTPCTTAQQVVQEAKQPKNQGVNEVPGHCWGLTGAVPVA